MILEFEKYAQEGNHFVNEVAFEMGADRGKAARITQVVLHALRDRMPVNDAIHFVQGLPMALKGIFIDQYEPGKVPVTIRSQKEFLDFIWNKLSNKYEFSNEDEIANGFRAVYTVLEKHMDPGQFHKLNTALPDEIVKLATTRGRTSM